MRFALERVSDPEIEPVTLDEMIQHVREFVSISLAAQTELTRLIVGGRDFAEDFTGRALIDQTWTLTLGDLVGEPMPAQPGYYHGSMNWNQSVGRGSEILLRRSPVLEVLSVATVDAAGAETVVASGTYQVREPKSKWPRLVALSGASWSTGDLKITFRAGFADRVGSPQQGAEMVPECFKQAIKLWVEAQYDRDKDMMNKLLEAAKSVLRQEKAELSIA